MIGVTFYLLPSYIKLKINIPARAKKKKAVRSLMVEALF
jgi:hypothetical protein